MIYAIDADKNHRIVSKSSGFHALVTSYLDAGEAVVEADPDGWIAWEPRPDAQSPLPVRTGAGFATMRLADGEEVDAVAHWDETPAPPRRVVAYRPILDTDTKPEPCRFHDDDAEACETYSGQVPGEPEPPAWDGESWPPPVGAMTYQLEWMDDRYSEVLIVGHHNGLPVGCTGPDVDDYQAFIQGELVPIRSAEDRAVDEMAEVIDGFEGISMRQSTAEDLARALYRAGLRFPKEAP